jgi:hypothetical protein
MVPVLRIRMTLMQIREDPDPACHFDADPDPDPDYRLMRMRIRIQVIILIRIRILPFHLNRNTDLLLIIKTVRRLQLAKKSQITYLMTSRISPLIFLSSLIASCTGRVVPSARVSVSYSI